MPENVQLTGTTNMGLTLYPI